MRITLLAYKVMKSLRKRVGERIRKRRRQMGFESQKSLADALDIEQSTVARWESGKSTPIDDNLERLTSLLKIEPEQLFTQSEPVFGVQPEDIEHATKAEHRLSMRELADLTEHNKAMEARVNALEALIKQYGGMPASGAKAEIEHLRKERDYYRDEAHRLRGLYDNLVDGLARLIVARKPATETQLRALFNSITSAPKSSSGSEPGSKSGRGR